MPVRSWNVEWVDAAALARGSGRTGSRQIAAGAEGTRFRAELSGFEEVPPRLTRASGRFEARLVENGRLIEYTLTFSNLSSPSTAAHLHFGQPGVNGEIFAFLCGGGRAPVCPGTGGTVTGTLSADDILGIPEQGLAPGDLVGALRILRAGLAYVNVHSRMFPAGEVRGQVRVVRQGAGT